MISISMQLARTVLTIILILVFAIQLLLNGFATPRMRPGFLADLYGNNLSTGDVSDKYQTEITPAGWAFSIWGIIYTWQSLWVVYAASLICRKHVPDVLSLPFIGLYILSCVWNATWIVIWQRLHIAAACGVLFAAAFTLYAALGISHYRLDKLYNDKFPKVDYWCIQVLVNNGIAFYATWCTIASLLNLTIAMIYVHGVAADTAATVALSILTCELIIWFIVENFVLERFLRYTVSQYFVVIWALVAIIDKHYVAGKQNSIFMVVILSLACVLYIARIIRVIMKVKQGRSRRSEDFGL